MPFYTRTGDDGKTSLLGKGRVSKHHARLETIGSLDESSAALGLARASVKDPRCRKALTEAQRDLYRLMSEIAATTDAAGQFQFAAERVEWIERQSDELSKTVEMPNEFILPGDSPAGAAMSLARAVVRRAERRVVELFDKKEITNPAVLQYMNRLSSLLFMLELIENRAAGKETTRAKGDSEQRKESRE